MSIISGIANATSYLVFLPWQKLGSKKEEKYKTVSTLLEKADWAIREASGDKTKAIEIFLTDVQSNPDLSALLTESGSHRLIYLSRTSKRSIHFGREWQNLEDVLRNVKIKYANSTSEASELLKIKVTASHQLLQELHRWEIEQILTVS